MKNKFYIVFSILFCIATLFMGVGYASINAISLDISGEMTAQAQDGIFITEVKYNDELSNNVNYNDSKINSAYQTNLDSNIVLTNNSDSQITYDITIYNSNSFDYRFDGIEYTVGENTYSNENITYKLTNLVEGNTVNSRDDINFSITFYYKDGSKLSDVKLDSILNFKFLLAPYVVATYGYTGNYETFIAPREGMYKFELWGAQGGATRGGNGGYSSGNMYLKKDETLYVYVGEHQERGDLEVAFNGGGSVQYESGDGEPVRYNSGGGATDIRLKKGEWNDFEGLKSRIIIAAGGGGGYEGYLTNYAQSVIGGAGGGIIGGNGGKIQNDSDPELIIAYGATQTSGGIAGVGMDIYITADGGFGYGGSPLGMFLAAGGGGYYGGGSSGVYPKSPASGSGGSSFISGHNGCDAITVTSTEDNIIHTGQSIHYSGYQFTDTVMIDGEGYNWTTKREELIGMPTYDGTGSMLGNTGDGYAKITFISE